MPADDGALPPFSSLLALEQVDDCNFEGWCHEARPKQAYGGQIAALALMAAGRTAPPSRAAHSLQGYFLRPGRVDIPMTFHVEKMREGRNFTARRVVAQQERKTVFTLACSLQDPKDGYEHQNTSMAPPPIPELAQVQDWHLPGRDEDRVSMVDRVLDIRLVGRDLPQARQQMWIRTRDKLGDALLPQAGALTYLSDFQLAFTTAFPHDVPRHVDVVSLDHTVWFHRSLRADDWLFVTQESTIANASRGLTAGKFHNQAGQLVASVAQEVLFVTGRSAA